MEAITWASLVRYHVLFVIDLPSRRVEIAGIVHRPHDSWMRLLARNLTDAVDVFLVKHSYLMMDRDPPFTRGFRELLAGTGVNRVRLPARRPNLNAYAERWIGSARHECLARIIPLGERHLRELIRESTAHSHTERNYQGLGNKLIVPLNDGAATSGHIVRRQRRDGVLKFYHREPA